MATGQPVFQLALASSKRDGTVDATGDGERGDHSAVISGLVTSLANPNLIYAGDKTGKVRLYDIRCSAANPTTPHVLLSLEGLN